MDVLVSFALYGLAFIGTLMFYIFILFVLFFDVLPVFSHERSRTAYLHALFEPDHIR